MRFRPRFTLRFLFLVITCFAVWLGWQVSIVRHRKALIDAVVALSTESYKPLNMIVDERTSITIGTGPNDIPAVLTKDGLPWYRKLLGDRVVPLLCLPASMTSNEIAEYRAAFPESRISQMERHRR
jgi:hypothetical protein